MRLVKWILVSAVALIVGLTLGADFVKWISGQEAIVQAALIASIGAPVTAFTHFLGQRVENKNRIEASFREKKIDLYLRFVTHLDSYFHPEQGGNRSAKQTVKLLLDFQRKLVFWCGPRTTRQFLKFKKALVRPDEDTVVGSVGRLAKQAELFSELLLAMRRDLGLSNRGIDKKTLWAELTLKEPELLFEWAKKNPEMLSGDLDEMASVAKER